jgi:diguanylate cyclase
VINDLFINILLLVSITFVSGHILKDISEDFIKTVCGKLLLGLCGGLAGILLMIYSIEVSGTATLLDLRIFSIMMVSYLGGSIPTIVAGIIIGIYRAAHFGINTASIIAAIQIVLYVITFYMIDKRVKKQWKKWAFKTLSCLLILISAFIYLLRNVENVYIILLQFSLVVVFTSALVYLLLEYVMSSNELYRMYKKDSSKDFLTGLCNTRQFDAVINSAFKRVSENGEKLACLMIDIDHFKKINDTYGHSAGDLVLQQLSSVLVKNCRSFDVVARIGGEEFCVLLFDCPKDRAFEIGVRINKAVEKNSFNIGDVGAINITVSVGVAVYPDTTDNLEGIKEKADSALYNAKRSGRNRVCDDEVCTTI